MTNDMPKFMPKQIAVPVFSTKEQALKADMFRCTASWIEDVDIDVVAILMQKGLPTGEPMSLIYQAGSKNPHTRTLKVNNEVIATLFDDDLDGTKGNKIDDTLEAAVYFPKRGLAVGYDSIAFAVLSNDGTPLSSLKNPIVRVEALESKDSKFLPIKGVPSYEINFSEVGSATIAIIALAFQMVEDWKFENVTKGISTRNTPESLEDLWNEGPIFLSRAIANYQ
jgi:hypothetical protein